MGMVSVRPGKLPAKVIVAPNSPSARAQHRTAPAPSDGAIIGTVTRRNTVIRRAPRVAAASSNPWSAERSAPSTVMIRNGMATKVSAITTAAGVNGMVSPNQVSSELPMKPVRPKASSSATPPTTGGSTSGRVTSARSSRWPGKRPRASSHASGTPMTREIAVAVVAVHSESWRAWVASAPLSAAARPLHGARIRSPASGSPRKAPAPGPAPSGGPGPDRDEPPRAARRARSRAVSRRAPVTGPPGRRSAPAGGSGLLEPVHGQHTLALRARDVGDELVRDGLVGGRVERRDRVQRRGVLARRDRHALDLGTRSLHVGHVDHPGVDVAQLDLGQHRLDVGLQGDGRDGDPGILEDLGGNRPARHL